MKRKGMYVMEYESVVEKIGPIDPYTALEIAREVFREYISGITVRGFCDMSGAMMSGFEVYFREKPPEHVREKFRRKVLEEIEETTGQSLFSPEGYSDHNHL